MSEHRRKYVPIFGALKFPGVAQRFWAKVEKGSDNECWNWRGAKRQKKNYADGHFKVTTYETAIAARCAFALGHNINPKDGLVLHTCDNSLCCNPAHLYLGTQAQNNQDTITRDRCPRRRRGQSRPFAGKKEEHIMENEKDV